MSQTPSTERAPQPPPVQPARPEPAVPRPVAQPLSPVVFGRLVLVLLGSVYLAVAVTVLADPVRAADWLDFEARTVMARTELAAVYVGLMGGLAAAHFAASAKAVWIAPGLGMGVLTVGGLFLGRTVGAFTAGVPGALGLALWAVEGALLALTLFAGWRLWRG